MSSTVFLGAGSMASAIAKGAFNSGALKTDQTILINKSTSVTKDHLADITSANITDQYDSLKTADIIFLGVKPQDFPALAESVKEIINPSATLVSMMAGISVAKITEALNNSKVIRTLPNLGSFVGLGMTGMFSSSEVDQSALDAVRNIFNTQGKLIELEEEERIDYLGSISASGPGYVYYFMEALEKAALEIGFSPEDARTLSEQTFIGSVEYLKDSGKTAPELRKQVSSKGGITIAATDSFDRDNFQQIIHNGIEANLKRTKELSST